MRVLDLTFLICKVSGLAWAVSKVPSGSDIQDLIPDLTKQKTSDERPAC